MSKARDKRVIFMPKTKTVKSKYNLLIKICDKRYEAKGKTVLEALKALDKRDIKGFFRYFGVLEVTKDKKTAWMPLRTQLRAYYRLGSKDMAFKIVSDTLEDKLSRA